MNGGGWCSCLQHSGIPRRQMKQSCGNVVLVENDFQVRMALSRLLKAVGFSVTSFERPLEVLISRLPARNVCLVLDLYMPEMTGVELWERLRTLGFDVPTILVTARKDARAAACGKRIGAVDVLYKPLEEALLVESILRALSRSGG